MKSRSVIATLMPLLRMFSPWSLFLILFLGMLASLSEGFGITLLIPFLQGLIGSTPNAPGAELSWLTGRFSGFSSDRWRTLLPLLIFGCILFKNIVVYGNTLFFSWLNSRIRHHLCSEIFSQMLHVNLGYLEQQKSGTLMNTLATETWQTSRALGVLVHLITTGCTFLVLTSLLALINWRLALMAGGAVLLFSRLMKGVNRWMQRLGRRTVTANENLAFRMLEGLGGLRVIRAFGREAFEQARFDAASDRVRKSFMHLDMLAGAVSPVYEMLSVLLLLLMVLYMGVQNPDRLPSLLTFLFVLHRLLPAAKQMDESRLALAAAAGSVDNVMAFLEHSDKPYMTSGPVCFEGLDREIQFEKVTFSYEKEQRPALHQVSFSISKGQTVALAGPSGGGKSTLIHLLCRFYEVNRGVIRIDGTPLQELNLKSWREKIAVVGQDVFMFNATVSENIAYGSPHANHRDIIRASRMAHAHDFVSRLPQGYETVLGERGVRLSGGQKQRIALARAMVKKPDLLILDEATNALDALSDQFIREALKVLRKQCTIIMIAHRISSILKADSVFVLEMGELVENGPPQELVKRGGLFARLYRAANGRPFPERERRT